MKFPRHYFVNSMLSLLVLTLCSAHSLPEKKPSGESSSLQQKVVLITGASTGIGLATAYAFEKQGWKVWAGFFPPLSSDLHSTERLTFHPLDVTDEASIQILVETLFKKEGRLDVLINNAGRCLIGVEECITVQEAQKVFDVNFFGPLRLIQEVLPIMRHQNSGHIINLSSIAGVQARVGLPIYSASKAALESLSETLSATVSPWSIKVSVVEPSFVTTAFGKNSSLGSRRCKEKLYGKITKSVLTFIEYIMPHGQTPQEIADLLVTIAINPHPDFRYQPSQEAYLDIKEKLVDPTGNSHNKKNIESVKRMIKR
jgi:NAD(P)-dependent dehydrogenase (short-subunit alcohol dehydrogenase family)